MHGRAAYGALAGLAALFMLVPPATAPAIAKAGAPALVVDRVVILMRHGVRPPTKALPMPAGTAAEDWPDWPVAPGWLTPHGAAAIARLAQADAAQLRAQRLLSPTGCPAHDQVAVIADSDQRTIATADAWLAALAPGCGLMSQHRAQDDPDPLFNAIESNPGALDAARANAQVAAAIGPGGLAALDHTERPLLTRLDQILCNGKPACGVGGAPSGLVPATPGKRPKLTGALDRASTAAQILLLEYTDGKPMTQVGWGRATAADITALSHFHALEFRLLARPKAVAAANFALIGAHMLAALTDATAPRVTVVVGHDTNIANLGGLLDAHWRAPGFAEDDPTPGGAIVLERLRDAHGALFVRAVYRSQSLDQIRAASPLAGKEYRAVLAIPGCRAHGIAGLCPIATLAAKLGGN
jgi:4-phytase/acid phosphatase